MKWKFLIAITAVLLVASRVNAQERPITNYTPDSELLALPSAMVTYVYQDRQGFIWFAVYSSGLVRFDGSRLIQFDQEKGLSDLGIWQILEDSNGYLWVSSHEGLVVTEKPLTGYRSHSEITFTSTFSGIPLTDDVLTHHRITSDNSGRVLAGTSDAGIIRYFIDDLGVMFADTVSTQIKSDRYLGVTSIRAGSDNSVLVSLEGGDLYRLKDNELFHIYSPAEVYGGIEIISMLEDDDDKIWIYRQNGEILVLGVDSDSSELIHTNPSTNINGLQAFSDGTVWATNSANGISRFDIQSGQLVDTYTRVTGLLSNNVFHALEDREGNMWIAQSGGVSKLRYNYRAFENISERSFAGEQPLLPSGRINTVFISENESMPCRFWAGTENGATCITNDGTSEYITQSEGLTGNWVNGLSSDRSDRIWVATTQGLNGIAFSTGAIPPNATNTERIRIAGYDGWLFTIPGSPPFIAAEDLLLNNNGSSRSVNSSWFPGLRSLYGIVDGSVYEFNMEHGLPSTLYKSVAADNRGYLWVGTLDRGLYKSNAPITAELLRGINSAEFEGISFSQFWSRDNGAPTNHIEKLLYHDGKVWIGTQEGLYAMDPENGEIIHHIWRGNGLLADNAVSFALSPKTGNLWVGTNRGLAEVDPQSGVVLKTVTRQDGLIDNEVWLYGSVKVDRHGSVYFGTANGLSIYHPDDDRINLTPPLLHLISFELTDQAEGRNEVVFEYAATSFGNTSQIRYRTRLLGYNEQWSPETDEVRLRYTNLPALFFPKTYTLEVMAVNESGIPSEEPLSFSFSIEPVWWLQWWAFLFYLLLLGSVIFIIDRVQRSRLIKKERDAARLREAELQAETAMARSKAAEAQAKVLKSENDRKALELEKARELEVAYHNLKAAQNQLIQAEKMASLGRLSTGIAHEIKNPLNFINNFAAVSNEMVDELYEAIRIKDDDEVHYILQNLKHNTGKIEEHGKRADSIVRSMMQHARGGKSTFEMIDLNDTVQKYVDLAYNGKRAKNPDFYSKLDIKLDPAIKEVKVMPQEIGQVLLNIIGNSLDAVWDASKNGKIVEEPEIKIHTALKMEEIEIRIADNGPGVPEELKEKIFEPFFTTKPTGEGTGLGLSLSYDIITQGHNGSLTLESRKGEGAAFIITLPRLS
ncbi:MAG: hypothetical protein JJU37_04165 [Balneolaceae bacterium]|nr:hypothetical protein [Balneolaceae bacterium]